MAKITELNALEAAITALEGVDVFEPEVLEKLRHMADNRRKTSGAKNAYANSKAAQEVRERAAGVLGFLLNQTEPRTNREIGTAVPGFLNPEGNVSPRRVVAALTKLKKQGLVEEAGKNKAGYATYQVTNKAREEWAAKQNKAD